MYQEKRIYLLQISSHLTASTARVLFSLRLPLCREKVLFEKGKWEQISRGKSTYIMMLCTQKLISEIEDILQLVVKTTDVTNNLVNDSKYVLKPGVIEGFDYVKFEKAYIELYLKEAPVSYAERRIMQMGNKSRYIDHQVVNNHRNK